MGVLGFYCNFFVRAKHLDPCSVKWCAVTQYKYISIKQTRIRKEDIEKNKINSILEPQTHYFVISSLTSGLLK